MDIDEALDFVRDNHHAVLATTRADGRPQMSPVAVGLGPDGTVAVSSRETAMKTLNIERRPDVSVCVFSDAFFGGWVQIDGTGTVIHLPEALAILEDVYRGIAGEHPNWDEYRQAMIDERRVVLSITPTRAGPDQSG
jgi:PPOX class probable F420-dependent enzyme